MLAGLHGAWFGRYNRDYNDNLTLDRLTGWDIHPHVKPECGLKIYDYLRAPDLYDDVRPIEGALAGINRFRELGHDVIFATSCYYGMVDQKARWLEREGFCLPTSGRRLVEPDLLPDDLFVGTNKSRLVADVLIEDAPHAVKSWIQGTRRRAILLDYPHNAGLDMPSMFWQWCNRANNWADIVAHIERMT